MQPQIVVTGLSDFVRGLRAADRELPREFRRMLNQAAERVAETAARLAEPQFITPRSERTGNLLKSIKPASTQREGRVKMGTPKRVPYAGWWEFGGSRPHDRPIVKSGRALYPALMEERDEIVEDMDRIVDALVTRIEHS